MRQTTLVLAIATAMIAGFASPASAKSARAESDGMAEVAAAGISSAVLIVPQDEAPNWADMVANDDGEPPRFRAVPNVALLAGPSGEVVTAEWTGTYAQVMRQAYAHAVLGHVEYAKFMVAEAEAGLAAARDAATAHTPLGAALIAQVEAETVRPIAAHVAARIALSEGQTDAARALATASTLTGPTGAELAAATGLPLPDRLPSRLQMRPRFAHAVVVEQGSLALELAALTPTPLALPAVPFLSDEADVAMPRPTLALSPLFGSEQGMAHPAIGRPYSRFSWTLGAGQGRPAPWQLDGILPLRPATAAMVRLPFD